MISDWKYYRLGDLIDVKHGWSFKGEFFRDEPTPYLLLTPGNFAIGGGFQLAKPKYYDGPIPEEFIASPGELIITMTDLSKNSDTLGYPAIVPHLPNMICLHNQRIGRVLAHDPNKIDLRYLYYVCCSKEYREEILASASGTAVKHTAPERIKRFGTYFPELNEQRAITRILGGLDNKIELNRNMNYTLEEIARALFKSWFVDFDPVIAKAEGRVPFGMNPETASRFPAEFEEVQDDALPKEWEIGSILNFANLLSGGTPSTHKAKYWDGAVAWVSAKDVSNANGLFVLSTERTITELGLQNSSAKLLPAKTTIVTSRGTVGKYCILGREMAMNQTNYGLRAKDGFSNYFTYFSLVFLVEQLQQNSYGTIFDTITTRTFQDSRTIIPSKPVIDAFEKRVTPMMNMILDNTLQMQTLTSIRDVLLPKLLSGELRVKQAKKVIENM